MERIRDNQKAELVKIVAEKHNVGTNYVYKVLSGERSNDAIFEDYMLLREVIENEVESYKTSPLLKAVNELVSFKK